MVYEKQAFKKITEKKRFNGNFRGGDTLIKFFEETSEGQ